MTDMSAYVNRGRNTMNALQNWINDAQQKEQQDSQDSSNVATMIAKQYLQLPPDVQQRVYSMLPDDSKRMLMDPSQLPAHHMTPSEQLPDIQSQAKIDAITKGAQPSMLPSDQNGNFSPNSALMADPSGRGNVVQPFDRLMGLQNRNRAVYGSDLPKDLIDKGETFFTQGTPGETQANRIANKQDPTGQETWTNANITAPKTKAEIAHLNAQTGEQGAAAENQRAQAGEHNAKAKSVNSFGPDPDTGAIDPRVANWVKAVQGAAAAGADPNIVLKKITDKKLAQAVGDELAKPENAKILQSAPLSQNAKTAISEIDPLIMQADKVIAAYAPFKDKNGLTDRGTVTYGLYRAGQKPPDGTPESELANMQMLGVQAGARLLKGGSRAYPALQMAMQHAPNGFTDTYANVYDKAVKLRKQLLAVKSVQLQLGGPVTAAGAAPMPGQPSDAANEYLKSIGVNP